MARFDQNDEVIRLKKANRKLRKTLRESKAANVLHMPRNNDRPRSFDTRQTMEGRKKPVQSELPFDVATVVGITLAVRDAMEKKAG
jgi:hypothetical protein